MRFIIISICLWLTLITSSNATTIESDMAQKIIDYRCNSVEKFKLRVYVDKHYKRYKHLKPKQYVAFSVLEICNRVEYAKGKVSPFDAYQGKANCQGYAFLFYMLMAKANVPCRIVYDDKHMWNEVMITDKWEKYDLTAMDRLL